MGKITKRAVDALGSKPNKDVFAWDSEMRGFGVRVKPSGAKAYLIQYRNIEGRTRRLVLGSCGVLTPEQARGLARQRLAAVAEGADPSADRHVIRNGMTVAEVCDWYLKEAGEGRLLGRNRRPIKATSIAMDRSRIETHIKPLLGPRLVSNLTLRDVEAMQADIAAGKSARGKKAQGRGGRSTGGAGVAARAISTFRALLGHATRLGLIEKNPASGVRQMASRKVKRRLSADEVRHLGKVMRQLSANGEHPTGLGAIRLMLLTGFRRMEALSLQRAWLHRQERAIHFPDTKSGEQLRVVGGAAIACIESQPLQEHSPYVFPADVGDGHFIGVVRVLERVCAQAKLSGVTPHVLRHTFASIAGDLGFSELTIAGLLGHTSRGVTQRYVHLDAALAVAADQVSAEIAKLLDGERENESEAMPTVPRRKRSRASSDAVDPQLLDAQL
ncbi:tyrosine-type recombinase/integrase [Acidibrevibacterium fodinaquatile]|uniref:tyrosine-type recombinase/integrase n=1 Tax=Acidibrevibacterium fodinaquatile TaxID=1969806 RepID=UPI000E0E053B|nr:site-specific integrase [Acidibrevibacterium fodinaquatile]